MMFTAARRDRFAKLINMQPSALPAPDMQPGEMALLFVIYASFSAACCPYLNGAVV